METIYGESPEIYKEEGYESNGGIALFSVRNGGEKRLLPLTRGANRKLEGKFCGLLPGMMMVLSRAV